MKKCRPYRNSVPSSPMPSRSSSSEQAHSTGSRFWAEARPHFMLLFAFVIGVVASTVLAGCAPSEPNSHSPDPSMTTAESAVEPQRAAEADTAAAPADPAMPGPREATPTVETPPATKPTVAREEEATSGDCPQLGGSSYRNNTPAGTNLPTTWNIGDFDYTTGAWISDEAENIKWIAPLGDTTYPSPVVAQGRIFVGTNNGGGYIQRYPSEVDLGCVLCFRESDGKFLWQYSAEKLPTGSAHDWELQGICSTPMVEGNRMWFVSNRGQVVCLDTEGYTDGEDDGPVRKTRGRLFNLLRDDDPESDQVASAITALDGGTLSDALRQRFELAGYALPPEVKITANESGAKWSCAAKVGESEREFHAEADDDKLSFFVLITPADQSEADVVWSYDMMKELGTLQHNMASCSVTSLGDLLFVNTSNGVDETHEAIPAPQAPSFIALDKPSGELCWTDASPGENILHGQWSSPAAGVLGGVPQVVFAGGDGWVYSFRADRGKDGKPELLWKFDANPKETQWKMAGRGDRNNIIATPVIYDGLVYIAVGQDPEHGEGTGHVWCIDPTKRGDVSPQLAFALEGDKRVPLPPRRVQAVDPEQNEIAEDNPNSAAVWHYTTLDRNQDGSVDFEEEMHRSLGSVAVKGNLLFLADFAGLFHCLDAKTGQFHWNYDMFAQAWGSPLIVDGHVYIGDEDGDLAVFNLSADPHVAMKEIDGELHPINADEQGDVPNMSSSVYGTPVVANNVLYISTSRHLIAIAPKQE